MDARASTERRHRGLREPDRRLAEAYAALAAPERLAVLGATVVVVSMFLPWYGVPFADLVTTGWAAFGWANAALLLTVGSVLALLLGRGMGHELPLPLRPALLISGGGAWAMAIVLYRVFDRPQFRIGPLDLGADVRYGIFVALAGSAVMILAGSRARRHDRRSISG